MKKKALVMAALTVCAFGVSSVAFAADAPAPKAPAAAPAAAPAPAPVKAPEAVKAIVTGKVAVKTTKVDNKDVKSESILVLLARSADGKVLADLKGKTLDAKGAKASDLDALDGKIAIVDGTVAADGKSIDVESAKEKPAAPKKPKEDKKK